MESLEEFIKRSNPEAHERWSIWHRQSQLSQEQVITEATRLMPLREGFGGKGLCGIFKFAWPLTSAASDKGLDRFLLIQAVDAKPERDGRVQQYVFDWSMWHFDFLMLSSADLAVLNGADWPKEREWLKKLGHTFEPWRWKRFGEDPK